MKGPPAGIEFPDRQAPAPVPGIFYSSGLPLIIIVRVPGYPGYRSERKEVLQESLSQTGYHLTECDA